MGFGLAEVQFLTSLGGLINFETTLTLGRQRLLLDRAALTRRLDTQVGGDGFADGFLRHLGAGVVDAVLDVSDFEGSSLVHDLNRPLPSDVHATYSAVIDAGTLEHVFNVTEGLRSAMSLVQVRGHLIMMTPCNNNPGHGFYQLTPEFVFRALSDTNGFAVIRCLLREDRGRWYNVADPAVLGRRREFRTRRSAYLFVVAERVDVRPIFAEWPQQSDYVAAWAGGTAAPSCRRATRVLARLGPLGRLARAVRARMYPPSYRLCPDQFTLADLWKDAP